MPDNWQPAPGDIGFAITLLKRGLPRALEVIRKEPGEIKDIYAIAALSDALFSCLPVLPPDVAALARQCYQAIQDAYKPSSTTNKRRSEQLSPDQTHRF